MDFLPLRSLCLLNSLEKESSSPASSCLCVFVRAFSWLPVQNLPRLLQIFLRSLHFRRFLMKDADNIRRVDLCLFSEY